MKRTPKPESPTSKADLRQTPYGIWKKSDRLLEFLLKGAKPVVYGDRSRVEVSGKVKQEYKFEGSMVELLALHRDLTIKEANDDE